MCNSTDGRLIRFLLGKPLWAWLLTYLTITGILFGAFNLALYLLGIIPWIGILALILAGLIWGTVMFFLHRNDEGNETDVQEKGD